MKPVEKIKDRKEKHDIIQQTTKVLGIFNGGAVLFYAWCNDFSNSEDIIR